MGRMRAEHRRRQILTVAAEQFAQNGYHGTTTADLAKAAGVTPPVLYRHFPGKRDLFIALLDDTAAEAAQAWTAVLDGESADARDRLLLQGAPPAARVLERLAAGVMDEVSRDVTLADAVARALRMVVESIAETGTGQPRAWLLMRWRLGAVHATRVASPKAIEASDRLMADLLGRVDQPISGSGASGDGTRSLD